MHWVGGADVVRIVHKHLHGVPLIVLTGLDIIWMLYLIQSQDMRRLGDTLTIACKGRQ